MSRYRVDEPIPTSTTAHIYGPDGQVLGQIYRADDTESLRLKRFIEAHDEILDLLRSAACGLDCHETKQIDDLIRCEIDRHSPGPWEACDNDGYSQWHIYSTSANLPIVAALHGDCAETEENARLIEAAPDMLRVLRVLLANGSLDIRKIIERIDGEEAE